MLDRPVIIWQLTDKKRGHENQSQGLVNAIKGLRFSESYLIDITSIRLKNLLLKTFPVGAGLPPPDLIIGAGRRSQFALVVAKRCFGGATICLMKPSLPIICFDLCVIPQHDKPKSSKHIFPTVGVLNNLSSKNIDSLQLGAILIGGPSKHYRWSNQDIILQLLSIITSSPQITWEITDSPRTPPEIASELNSNTQLNKFFKPFKKTKSGWLESYLPKCKKIWVTEDSVSMMYEALSTNAEVGLISVPKKRNTRVTKIAEHLLQSQLVTSLSSSHLPKRLKLNEAERTASFIINRWWGSNE